MPRISFFCKVETTVSPEHTGSEGRRALPSRHRPRVRALVPRPCAWFGVPPARHSSACSLPLCATAKCASCLARMLKYSFCLLRQPFKPGTPTGAEFILPVAPLARALSLVLKACCASTRGPARVSAAPKLFHTHWREVQELSSAPPAPLPLHSTPDALTPSPPRG